VNWAQVFIQAFAPRVVQLAPGVPFDLRRRYWPPHRPVGTPKKLRAGSFRVKLSGGKGLR
jgi:hypothetical protein